jgi:hypothetical protein
MAASRFARKFATVQAITSMAASRLAGKFATVSVDCGWHDGWDDFIYEIVGTTATDGSWHIRDENGSVSTASPVNIKNPFDGKCPTYAKGQKVYAVIESHQFAGETYGEGTIEKSRVFGNTVRYSVRLRNGTLKDLGEGCIENVISEFTPDRPTRAQEIAAAEQRLLAEVELADRHKNYALEQLAILRGTK